MPGKVVDASALAAILFGEPEAESVASQLGDSHLRAPVLIEYELANVCLIKCKRNPEQREALIRAFDLRREFDLEYMNVDLDGTLLLAAQTGLTVYDASYLWLARTLGSGLVTLDRQLLRAVTQ